ncbi:MAG: ferrochelatase [Thermoplasmata archaeon]|nr:ferrochelatase [Thermoplasmata archaeon]
MTEGGRTGPPAVLLMGYGSPGGPEDIPGYLADVLARPPTDDLVEEYRRRYALIGGSPQNRVLGSLRTKLEERLRADGDGTRVYLGTKHWSPHIADVLPAIAADGFDTVTAVPLSPYASTWIMEPYLRAVERGRAAARRPLRVDVRSGWHTNSHLIAYWRDAIRSANEANGGAVLLSAHSLPTRMAEQGDPYPKLLDTTATAIATAAELPRWSFTFQSAGNTTEPWLGPDITEVMTDWQRRGVTDQLVASFGFVFDHLETLYDLDVVVRAFAEERGIPYRRAPMPNDDDRVVAALADVVHRPNGPALDA